MTREKAISYLWQYMKDETFLPTKRLLGWKINYDYKRAVYERFLVRELIRAIEKTDCDPIETVRRVYYGMDERMSQSEESKTWAFASIMGNCAADILRYLRRKEKNENAKNGSEGNG